jgi:hypothetical protein
VIADNDSVAAFHQKRRYNHAYRHPGLQWRSFYKEFIFHVPGLKPPPLGGQL